MGSGRRADSGWLSGVGSIGALHGVLARGSQRLFSVPASARSLARTFARRVAVVSRIVHGKSPAIPKIPREYRCDIRVFLSGRDYARCSHARDDLVQEQSQELVLQLLRRYVGDRAKVRTNRRFVEMALPRTEDTS